MAPLKHHKQKEREKDDERLNNIPIQNTPFVVLLLKATTPERHEYPVVLSSIPTYSRRLRNLLLEDGSTRDSVLLSVDRVLPRLEMVFDTMKTSNLPGDVSEHLFQGIVSPLIDPQGGVLSLDQSFQLVGSALPVLIKHTSPYLHRVAHALLGVDGLVERLITHGVYSRALKDWLSSSRNYLNDLQVKIVSERLISLCDRCSADHGISDVSERWHKVQSLIVSLKALLDSIQNEERNTKMSSKSLPRLADMKVLSSDDKKKSRARSNTQSDFHIPGEILEQITSLDMQKPESSRALSSSLEHLEKETPSFMHSALNSFPCRVCWERLTGILSDPTHASTADKVVGAPMEYDLFGKRIGLWKVLLSDRALRSSRKLARTGSFDRVEQKFRDLASGDWKGKDLSNRAGSKKQQHVMRIPILQAEVANLFILWQIDIGFYEDLPSVQQHIVKVWDIVDHEDLPNTIKHIMAIQESYDALVVQFSCKRPLQQSDGRFLPDRFDNVRKGISISGSSDPTKAANQLLIEMSNKFYNLTEPFLSSIIQPTGREEFPFDLSPEEVEIVSHFNTSSLILGRSGTGKTTCLAFKIFAKYRARNLIPDEAPVRQLLLTRSPYLASKLQEYVKNLIDTQCSKKVSPESQTEATRRALDKTRSFIAMEADDFPFVCTYDEFLGLLETTIRRADRKDFSLNDEKGNGSRFSNGRRVIDFNIFKTEYWSCISGMVPCSPELLFSEIMGVIKGSSTSATTFESLSREQYVYRSGKLSPAFSTEAERERVYLAFERYERLKKQRGELDELDRVIDTLKALKSNAILGQLVRQCFEEIYVDEVQDLRCLDIVLLLSCVCDPRGVHLAGDTAQCISKDSVFRFPEIKALFFEHFSFIGNEIDQPELARPRQFALVKNYRSHQGILSLASFVMRMLWTGFPDTIDKLEPEIGQTGGPRPIIFAGFDSSILSAKMIGLVKLNDKVGDFGAEQVILVRDDTSKDKLQKQIGEIALVLTILESKGMEFDDVLAYDFFSDSDIGSSYRCLHLLAQGDRKHFDSQKHAALCSELKHLYVAVTRARNQLWFVESSEASVKPVLEALNADGSIELVDTVRQKDPDVAEKVKVLRAGGSVDPERWFKRGAHLLHQKNFTDALFCFKKANDNKGVTQCEAWLHEQQGRIFRASEDMQGFNESYEKAIALFLEIGLISEAADCLEGLEQYERVARLWKDHGRLREAGMFFEKGGFFYHASECHHLEGDYEEAIDVLRRGDQFDHLINYITANREFILAGTLHRYSRLCNILLRQGRISPELRAKTIDLLGSDVDKEAFFKEFEMLDHLRSFYESTKKYQDLYNLCLSTGDLHTALDTAISHRLAGSDHIEHIFNYVVAESIFTRRGLATTLTERCVLLLQKAHTLPPVEKAAEYWQEAFLVFASVDNEDVPIDFAHLQKHLSKAFFCTFAIAFEKKIFARSKISLLPITLFWWVTKLLQTLTPGKQPLWLSLLCGIFKLPGQRNIILPWSPLHEEIPAGTESLSEEEIAQLARRWMLDKFSMGVSALHDAAFNLMEREFPPRCIHFLTRGSCPRQKESSCNFAHEKADYEFCSAKIAELLKISSVFTKVTPLYYLRMLNEQLSKSFLPIKRRWLERLIEELTFASSTEQTAMGIHMAKDHLLNNQNFFVVGSSLEELLFYRLKKEWEKRQSLSVLLEQVQLARFLGDQVNRRFFRALSWRVHNDLRSSRYTDLNILRTSFGAVAAAERIRSFEAKTSPYDFCAVIERFLGAIEQTPTASFAAFEAVTFVFEFAATYLMCISNPSNAVVIPWSWAIGHLPAIMKSRRTMAEGITEEEKLRHGHFLQFLAVRFSKLLERLENETRYRGMKLTCAGKRNLPPVIIKRRNGEFLAIVALNLGHWPIPLRGLSDVLGQIHEALTFLASPGFTSKTNPRAMRAEFIRSFRIYGEKDGVRVLSLDDSGNCPLYLSDFVKDGARQMKLSRLLEIHGITESERQSKEQGDKFKEEYTSHELKLIVTLQRRWRYVLLKMEETRQLRKTAEGSIMADLDQFCRRKLDKELASSALPPKSKIAIRAFLFTDALSILVDLSRSTNNIKRLREIFRVRLASSKTTAELEELTVLPAQFNHFEAKLKSISDVFSVERLESTLELAELKANAREFQRVLRTVNHELRIIENNLAIPGDKSSILGEES